MCATIMREGGTENISPKKQFKDQVYLQYLIRSCSKKLSIIVNLVFSTYSLNAWVLVRFSKLRLPNTLFHKHHKAVST